MSDNRPTSESTLAIILGASEWPDAPEFMSSNAFKNAASGIREYLTLKFGEVGLSEALVFVVQLNLTQVLRLKD